MSTRYQHQLATLHSVTGAHAAQVIAAVEVNAHKGLRGLWGQEIGAGYACRAVMGVAPPHCHAMRCCARAHA